MCLFSFFGEFKSAADKNQSERWCRGAPPSQADFRRRERLALGRPVLPAPPAMAEEVGRVGGQSFLTGDLGNNADLIIHSGLKSGTKKQGTGGSVRNFQGTSPCDTGNIPKHRRCFFSQLILEPSLHWLPIKHIFLGGTRKAIE